MNEAKFTLTPQNARGVMRSIWDNLNGWFENGNLDITIRPHKSKRSIEQNKRLWFLYREISEKVFIDGKRFSQDVWHEFLKRKFIGCIEMPNGQLMGISTTKLSVQEMSEYQEKIISWAAMEHGVLWD